MANFHVDINVEYRLKRYKYNGGGIETTHYPEGWWATLDPQFTGDRSVFNSKVCIDKPVFHSNVCIKEAAAQLEQYVYEKIAKPGDTYTFHIIKKEIGNKHEYDYGLHSSYAVWQGDMTGDWVMVYAFNPHSAAALYIEYCNVKPETYVCVGPPNFEQDPFAVFSMKRF